MLEAQGWRPGSAVAGSGRRLRPDFRRTLLPAAIGPYTTRILGRSVVVFYRLPERLKGE